MHIDLTKIKLIIWDLDDTLWNGTLSEGGAQLPVEHSQLIADLTDAGIINSICSKNDLEPTKAELLRIGIWDYFVFPSINWDNKGVRIKHLIDNMALRPVNVLFVDDNTFNLQDAKHCLPDLQIATPDIIPTIIEQLQSIEKKDTTHKRLQQYKILEEKATIAETYDSNEAFLFSSNIRVTIHTDCSEVIERLHELLMRSNQLNYTKKRIPIDELKIIVSDSEYQCGYVTVTDNYGDYGIVGFYANKGGYLEHFLFSCRTMGQMIEQYVYAQLGFPKLEIVGDVRTQLNNTDCPAWINQKGVTNKEKEIDDLSCKILLKGPCDLSNTQGYIKNQYTTTEFTYIKADSGQEIDTYNHSVHIRSLYESTEDERKQIIEDCPFVDPQMLSGTFYTGNYDVIFLSSLIESVYPIYKKKDSSIKVVYREAKDKEREKRFFEQYEYVGLTTPEQYRDFLVDSLDRLPKTTTLCIILGSTLIINGSEPTALRHQVINEVVKDVAKHNTRLRYIEVDDFVKSSKDITDNINHYQARVYYDIAQAMIGVIKEVTGIQVAATSQVYVYLVMWIKFLRPIIKKIFAPQSMVYKFFQKIYFKITRRTTNVK